ncbi:hypothetical protein [Thiorhodovibrio frisius]|uniref:Bacterial CdiA-CT RNAse A domain-containing protein n=1 Tax=Thiorhodovibrio frisius TaxID=631362 RepID=H8Z7B2_9GAMM|nr:hypothetical protein [Thiorhodovibrio frisius]EIC19828.1 hypothetical protein Thi970DRAFT_03432 [Thiorhodovibrio frisius]WPL20556.1 hypothetical protein Thiofri_00655 [Thiorhodovibrio frisius]
MRLSLFSFLVMLLPFSANAGIKCSDVRYGSENYHEDMEKLAELARLSDGYNRYHEDVVSGLCTGNLTGVASSIDNGYVRRSEVEAIKEVLGLDDRSDSGKSYGFSRQKFSDMGLCSACADNVAQHYTRTPTSKCGTLARHALEGDPIAVEKLRSFPSYCEWKYSGSNETKEGPYLLVAKMVDGLENTTFHTQATTESSCRELKEEVQLNNGKGKRIQITFTDPPYSGYVISIHCINPDGVIQ